MKPFFLSSLIMLSFSGFSQNPLIGRTTGMLPYLEYGVGDDRLGGAKMTYLDTNILMKVVDSTKDDYKVQLSAQHIAYLPKVNFRKDDSAIFQPNYLTGSWRVFGDEKYDYVMVALPEKLPYKSMQLLAPSRIAVDIFGAVSNTNWITQLKTVKEISNVWHEQIEDDVFRVFIELKHKQHWGYAIYYKNNTLTIRVKRQPATKIKHLNIAIDAGHGGLNTGATGINTKILEKDYTLMIAKELQKYIKRKHANIFMTRENDVDISMVDRTVLLRAADPDVLISIHLNSSSNKNANGVSTYYRYPGFRPLSQSILNNMLDLDLNNFGNIGSFNFSLSGPTEYPNCLVEVAFLSNADDEQKIVNKKFQKQVARKIYKGLKEWLKDL